MLFDAIGKAIFGLHQNKLANQIHPEYHPYQTSPYAKQELGLAQQLFNGRMFGASNLEQNIFANQANYLNNVNRNATDSSQALALGGLAQGQTNNALQNLQTQEAQNKYDLLGNLNKAYQTMIGEGDKVYQDQLQKYQIDTQQQAGLRNAAWQNIFSGISDFESGGLQAAQLLSQPGMNGQQQGGSISGKSGGGTDISKILPYLMIF